MTGRPLILSVFPGIDLLGRAFEEVWPEACVVRGPDLLWGGEIKTFHPPPGVFDGVIGGPPCQRWSRLRFLVEYNGHELAEDLIPEFARLVSESEPAWFLMEEVPEAPLPHVPGYGIVDRLIADVWVGGETSRRRRFSFGLRGMANLSAQLLFQIEMLALHRPDPMPAVLASGGGRDRPVAIGGSGRPKSSGRISKARDLGYKTRKAAAAAAIGQGLPEDFLNDGPFTVSGRIKMIGNGVPMAMGRAVAWAVRQAVEETAPANCDTPGSPTPVTA